VHLANLIEAAWATGEVLDLPALLCGPTGEAKAAVVSIAHLSDAERQLVMSRVLSKLVSWMRSQAGSSTLRVLLYIDEVSGFVPPVAAPASKAPILTLLKQAAPSVSGWCSAPRTPSISTIGPSPTPAPG